MQEPLITAIFCRFFEISDLRNKARVWAKLSKRLFDGRTEAVSLAAIQACVLLSLVAFGEGEMQMESLYGAQAVSMVQLRGFPAPLSNDAVQQETEIRGKLTFNHQLISLSYLIHYSLVDRLDAG